MSRTLQTRSSVKASPDKRAVLVVDDHPIVREGLANLINRQPNLCAAGQATTLAEARKAISAKKPDIVLLDLQLGTADGLESIKALRAEYPDLRVLVMSQFDETVYAERALRAGALGYVMKERATGEILQAIRTVLQGEIYVSLAVGVLAVRRMLGEKPRAGSASNSLRALSDREVQVFRAVGLGKANKQIAAEFGLSVKTIETYREHIKYKLGLANGVELVQEARRAAETDLPFGNSEPPQGIP